MTTRGHDPLLLAGKILTLIMQAAVGVGAAAVAVALPVAILFQDDVVKGIAQGRELPLQDMPIVPIIGLMAIVLLFLAAMFVFFGKLRAIIGTVGEGDPFVPANADRLNLMAWLMLGIQALSWPLVATALHIADWAGELDDIDLKLEANAIDLSGILMVLVLFILARVFRHGAAMREDLEGTV